MKGGVVLCILLFSVAIAGAQKSAPANLANASGDNKYVGSQACQDCHPNITETFYRNPHNKSIVSQKELPERTGCEGCHGPGGQHIAAGDGGTILLSRAFPRSRCWTLASSAIAKHSHAPTSGVPHTRSMASCAPTAIPFTAPRRPRIYWPRPRRICATAATLTCARSFPCPSNTASTKVS